MWAPLACCPISPSTRPRIAKTCLAYKATNGFSSAVGSRTQILQVMGLTSCHYSTALCPPRKSIPIHVMCLNFAITQHLHGGRSDRVIKPREAPARSRQLPSRFVVLSAGNCPPATGWIRADTSRHRYDGSRLIVRSWREVDRRRGYTVRRLRNGEPSDDPVGRSKRAKSRAHLQTNSTKKAYRFQ